MSISQHLRSLSNDERIAALKSCLISLFLDTILAMLKKLQVNISDKEVFQHSEAVFLSLTAKEWLATFATHPKIGDPPAVYLKQEFKEQSGFSSSCESIKVQMPELNRKYYDKFGFIFITCATGKTGEQMLAEIEQRLQSSFSDEIIVAASQQCQITALRLERLVPKSNL